MSRVSSVLSASGSRFSVGRGAPLLRRGQRGRVHALLLRELVVLQLPQPDARDPEEQDQGQNHQPVELHGVLPRRSSTSDSLAQNAARLPDRGDHDHEKKQDRRCVGREDLDGVLAEIWHQAIRSCAISALRRRARISVRVR
jgi:hypothetical protein